MPSPDNITRDFKALCARAGLGNRQTIHGLRHDYASLLAGDWVIVTGTAPLGENRVMATSVQRVDR